MSGKYTNQEQLMTMSQRARRICEIRQVASFGLPFLQALRFVIKAQKTPPWDPFHSDYRDFRPASGDGKCK
ncbi:MAG: hypothetical protein ACK42D_03535 [Candidatus Paceibacteria bacterium]